MPHRHTSETLATLASTLTGLPRTFDRSALERIALELLLPLGAGLNREQFPAAAAGQERLYPLVEVPNGPALYLVSDGVGTTSPPHEHQTWALIVGIGGDERNVFYTPQAPRSRRVRPVSEQSIRTGDFAILETSAIHSTSVVGTTPTYHLHLYGRSLRALPAFDLRVYTIGT